MQIPIAKDKTQFNVPTAQTSSNIGNVLNINTGIEEATNDLIDSVDKSATLFAKMKVESDIAKASNDYLSYKRQMNDLLYSSELDENGEPKGFIYKTGENAFNSLKEYDAKSSALYSNFTKQLEKYIPVATENAFKSANDFNEGFRNMMMKHATQENEKFKEESLKNYMSDTIAHVGQDLLSYNDNNIAYFNVKRTEVNHRIMQYYIAKGFPQAGKELCRKFNGSLLETLMQQVALNNSNDKSMFGAYYKCEELLNEIKKENESNKGEEFVTTSFLANLGKKVALREFNNAFYNKDFEYDNFFKTLEASEFLDGNDKNRLLVEYKLKYDKLRNSGVDQSTNSIMNFISSVGSGARTNQGLYAADLKYIPDFLYNLNSAEYSISETDLIDSKTKKYAVNEQGDRIKDYNIVFKDENLQNYYNNLPISAKKLLKTFTTMFAKRNWILPNNLGVDKISKLANSKYEDGVYGQQKENIDKERLLNQFNNTFNLNKSFVDSTSKVSIIKDENGKEFAVPEYKIEDFSKAMFDIKKANDLYKEDGMSSSEYDIFVEHASNFISNLDTSILNNKTNIVRHKGLFGFVNNVIYSFDKKISQAEIFRTFTEKGNKGVTRGVYGLMTLLNSSDNPMYEELDPNDRSELRGPDVNTSVRNRESYNDCVKDLKDYNEFVQKGGIPYKSNLLMQTRNDLQYKLSTEGGIGINAGLDGYTAFMGQLTIKDWRVIDAFFFTKIVSENNWKDDEAVSRYQSLIDNNPVIMQDKYRQFVANYLIDNKDKGLYKYDSINNKWNELNQEIPFKNNNYNDGNFNMPVTLYPLDLKGDKTLKNQIKGTLDTAVEINKSIYNNIETQSNLFGTILDPFNINNSKTVADAFKNVNKLPKVDKRSNLIKKAPKGNYSTIEGNDINTYQDQVVSVNDIIRGIK